MHIENRTYCPDTDSLLLAHTWPIMGRLAVENIRALIAVER